MATSCKRAKISTKGNETIVTDDVLVKIIQCVPLDKWARLRLVSRQFKRCVQCAYRSLKSFKLKNVFLPEFGKYSKKRGKLEQCLKKLINCCPRLQTISDFDCLSDNISSSHLQLLQKLTELKNISFYKCRINISVLSRFLKKFPHMKSLAIRNCDLWHDSFDSDSENDQIIENCVFFNFFEKFSGLVELTISDVQRFSGYFLSMINADSLKVLDFNESQFNGTYVAALLKRCINLETLYLYCPLTRVEENVVGLEPEVLECLPKLPKLRKFQLKIYIPDGFADHDLTYHGNDLLKVLVQCKMLRDFRFGYSDMLEITDDFLSGLIAGCPLLETLMMNNSFVLYVSKTIIAKIADFHNLTSLSISHYAADDVLKDLCSKLHVLRNLSHLKLHAYLDKAELLSLKTCDTLTSFIYFGDNFTNRVVHNWIKFGFLQKLSLLELFSNLSYSSVERISKNVPVLETFCFHGGINDESLLLIGKNCKRLKMAELRECSTTGLSENGLLQFLSHCTGLVLLFLDRAFIDSVPRNVSFEPYKHVIRFDEDDDYYNSKLQ